MKGHVSYATGHFDTALELWTNALAFVKRSKVQPKEITAELLNNIGCIHFETGAEAKAMPYFKESLQLQKKAIFESVHDGNEPLYQHMLVKLAATRANLGYIHLRMKNADLAILTLEESLLDQKICLDPHAPLVTSTMDYLAIAYLRKGNKDDAINIYSQMLTAKIEANGAEHVEECAAILTKLSLLQVRGNDKASVRSILKKIQQCIRDNPCQKERFEKLLKVCKVSGLKSITVRGKNKYQV